MSVFIDKEFIFVDKEGLLEILLNKKCKIQNSIHSMNLFM